MNEDHETKLNQIHQPDINQRNKNSESIKKWLLPGIILTAVVIAAIFMGSSVLGGQSKSGETITVSTLEKMIDISEFNTFQAVYNGIAEVKNKEKSDQIDYYVSYQAKIKAGFDFKKVIFREDKELKKLFVEIPEIIINDTIVEIASLDYMFLNDKANQSGALAQAYSACIEDAELESKKQSAIYELAKQNAKNVMKALINPFLDQMEEKLELEFIFGGV